MGMINIIKWFCLSQIIKKFGIAMGLVQNEHKSIILYGSCNQDDITYIKHCFGVNEKILYKGMKYLGYRLKLGSYKNANWMWLVERFYLKIKGWEHRCLSLGGCIILTQSVLTHTGIY